MTPQREKPNLLLRLMFNRHSYSIGLQRLLFESFFAAMGVPRGTICRPAMVGGVGCEWLWDESAAPGPTVLYLHGGGFYMGTIRSHRPLVARLCRAASARGCIVDYRRTPEHPYPAALDDALTVYRALLRDGVPPERLVLAGESAGGGLVVATMLVLKQGQEPLPAAAVVLSPWTDLSNCYRSESFRRTGRRAFADLSLRYMAKMYHRYHDPRHPFISPIYGDLTGLPPLLIHVAEDEPLTDDALRLQRRAQQCGVRSRLETYSGSTHVVHSFAPLSQRALDYTQRAAAFIREHTGPENPGPISTSVDVISGW